MKVKQSIELTLTGIAAKGMAVGRTTSGLVVFVKDAVPGDVAMVYLYKKRKSYFEGRLEKLISPSPDRISAKCSHFAICGGFQGPHLLYSSPLEQKQEKVHQNFFKIGSFRFSKLEKIIPS